MKNKMAQEELFQIYKELKYKQKVSVVFNSCMYSNVTREFVVGRRSFSKKHSVEHVILINPKNPKGMKCHFYYRETWTTPLSFAEGNMATELLQIHYA